MEAGTKFRSGCGTPVEGVQAGMPTQNYAPQSAPQYRQAAAMNPWEYFVAAMKKYGVFTGRARRAEFWWFALFSGIISFVADFIGGFVMGLGRIPGNIAALFFLLPGIAVAIRRMHDVGKSGWYCLIPIYGWIVLPVTEGNRGPNQYGHDPKDA
jgi:uncharacterized membrane protein YhaH (DUF805 family)